MCAERRLLSQLPSDFVHGLSTRILEKRALELERFYDLINSDNTGRHLFRLREIVDCQIEISKVLHELHENGVDYDILIVQESYLLVLEIDKYLRQNVI